jgi:NADPH:quinone reductase-like Zn-dependent oxidoreductase
MNGKMKAYEISEFGIENLSLVERDEPKPQANEVLVKFHAASLNYRDLMMVKGFYKP